MTWRNRTIGVALAASLVLAACGGDDEEAAEAAPTPTATATPFAPIPTEEPEVEAEPSASTYVVESGDTLSSIAVRFSTTVDAIVELNGLADPDTLAIGDELQIPGAGGATDDAAVDDATVDDATGEDTTGDATDDTEATEGAGSG